MRLDSGWLRAAAWLSLAWLGAPSAGCSATPPASKRGFAAAGDSAVDAGGAIGAGGFNPGAGGAVVVPGGSGGMGGVPVGCNDLAITFTEVVPTVLLLVDTSSSMFEPRTTLWDPLYNALMDPTVGVIKPLQDKVRFGFTSYNSVTQPTFDTQCPKLSSVAFDLNNYDAINTAYLAAGVTPTSGGFKWETPTGESIQAVTATLAAYNPMPAGPKYILLVTDGNPDTCVNRDPQCGADASIKAVQDAFAAGIGTFVVGIGDILSGTNAGCVGRCGVDHLQDIANAGTGQPVAPNSNEYGYQVCTGMPANERAAYAAAGQAPGSAPYYTATSQAELQTAIAGLINDVRSCTFEMNAKVTGDPSQGTVLVDGRPAVYNDPNGWKLESNAYQVTLQGTSCDQIKTMGKQLNISFPCDVIVPR